MRGRVRKYRQSFAICAVTAMAGMLASCASTEPSSLADADLGGSEPSSSQQLGEILLASLTAAEKAADANDTVKLSEALRTIELIGAKPLTEQDSAKLAQWKARVPQEDQPTRGRALGPAYRSGKVAGGKSAVIEQIFFGGTPANLSLRVPKGSALRLRVTDRSNRRVCEKQAREAQCRWLPLFTQQHRIELANDRAENAHYLLVFD